MTIGEKLFSYINVANDLTPEMVSYYRSSLIFLGDEQQIYHPLTGAYVGIGMTYFNQVKEQIADNTRMLQHLDTHIHQNVVNSLLIEYNSTQFNSVLNDISSGSRNIAGHELYSGDWDVLMTNQDIILKGLHDYDRSTGRAKATDDIGNPIKDLNNENINNLLWEHINLGTYGSSGITINVHHTAPGIKRDGIDDQGFSYSYWEGQDYITIDDSLTWSYIAAQTSYLISFAKQMAVTQANRVYHDILGGNDPVYIEKEFNEVFTFDEYGDLVQIVEGDKGRVFVHADNPTAEVNVGEFLPVFIYNDPTNTNYYIYTMSRNGNNDYYVVDTNDSTFTGANGRKTISVDDGYGNMVNIDIVKPSDQVLKDWLFADDGYDKLPNGEWKVAWYHIDEDATAQGQMNLADGIQTLKEVSYILDRITDGSDDDIINITYNIAQNHYDIENIKQWQENIGDFVPTSVENTTQNKFILTNTYAADKWEPQNPEDGGVQGNAKLDIDLRLAQTYTIDQNTYAAYIYNLHSPLVTPIWRYLGDTTNMKYWINLKTYQDINGLKNDLATINPNGNGTIDLYSKNGTEDEPIMDVERRINISDLAQTNTDLYVLFNYELLNNLDIKTGNVLDGITTVNWVTTYFGWAQIDIMNEVNRLDDDVRDWVEEYINSMNVSDSEVAGHYVTKVEQTNGKIIVTKKKLPLNTIIYSPEIYGNDFFTEITEDLAKKIIEDENDDTPVYWINSSNDYQITSTFISGIPYYLRSKLTNFRKVTEPSIDNPTNTDLMDITNELLLNEGNFTYFRNTSLHQVEASSGNYIGISEYVPVDINELLSEGSLLWLTKDVINSLYYYVDNATLSKSSKYFDVSYMQNTNGSTDIYVTSYVTYLGASSKTNTGLADSYDVRHTIESMFSWVNLKTNKIIN